MEQPNIHLLIKETAIMPDGSIGCVEIGFTNDPRENDLRLTKAQAKSLARQIWINVVGIDPD